MNKTMSKARELLINSRLMKKNEIQDPKIGNQANPSEEVIALDHNRTELKDMSNIIKLTIIVLESDNKLCENNIDHSIKSIFDNSVGNGNVVIHSQGNPNIIQNQDERQFKITMEKDTDNDKIILTNANAKKEDMNGLKSKLTDRLALFENRTNAKENDLQSNNISLTNKEKQDKIYERPEQNKLIVNKPNLLDRFNKNINKGPVIIKQSTLPVKEGNMEGEETNNSHPEMKLTSVEQEKLMKRMISAKVNKGQATGKDLGKSKASEKIMGLASMLENKLGPKDKDESLEKKPFLLTNDADIQMFNDDNKAIENKTMIEEPDRNVEQKENRITLERKNHIEMMLEKPMFNTRTTKKRTQKTFQLKDDN